jgi:HK97 family phage prohead protease
MGRLAAPTHIERYRAPLEVAELDPEAGTFRGYATLFSSVIPTFVDTRFARGSFAKTLSERPPESVKILFNHDLGQPLGLAKRLQETDIGLELVGKLSRTPQTEHYLTLLKDKVIDSLSLGFDTLQYRMEQVETQSPLRIITEARIWEVSLCLFGLDPQAKVLDVFSCTPYQDLPLASPDTVWDPEAAEARLRAWAGAESQPTEALRRAYLWVDPQAPQAYESHRLPIADVVSGELRVIPQALSIARACLPAFAPADRARLSDQLTRYEAKAAQQVDEPFSPLAHFLQRLPTEAHVGKMLSAKNKKLITDCMTALQHLLMSAEPPDADEAQALAASRLDQLRAAELIYAEHLLH